MPHWLILAAAVIVTISVVVPALAWACWPSVPTAASAPASDATLSEVLRTNGEIFGGALQDAIARAERAVAESARVSAQLETCQRDLQQRDEYLKAAAPEVRALREQLREAQDALTRAEAYFGAAAMIEAQRHRGWLRRALAMGAEHAHAARSLAGGYAVARGLE